MGNQSGVDKDHRRGAVIPGALWSVLVVSAAINSIGFPMGIDLTTRMVAGGVTLLCVVLLVIHHRVSRDR
ncbi:hypothetical protein [Actinokineospora sp. NBRC 105648]|uniref:hypothetical protein n=1 Tax=Actinokineospora sp. NBRC 105648 TaxID=3032206 RepID=UPI0024A4D336|nr:hypothetical protein [Actinokineospora sp. NBRC 105648]GLZ42534.1 hypothetical protein Acsp05_61580 [Actinokineospora sp. NBRC 105648]